MKYIVRKTRKTDYPHPLILKKNDIVETGKRCTEKGWEDWIMCTANRVNGWVPAQYLEYQDEKHSIIIKDYEATELNIQKDEILTGKKILNEWVWCTNGKNEGWVPLDNIIKIE